MDKLVDLLYLSFFCKMQINRDYLLHRAVVKIKKDNTSNVVRMVRMCSINIIFEKKNLIMKSS